MKVHIGAGGPLDSNCGVQSTGVIAVYVVPEELREDFEHYRNKIESESEKQRSDGKVLYRYSRRQFNKQVVLLTKIALVLTTGFLMLAFLCSFSDKSEKYQGKQYLYSQDGYMQSLDKHPIFGAPARSSASNVGSAVQFEGSRNASHAKPVYQSSYAVMPVQSQQVYYRLYQPSQQAGSWSTQQPTMVYTTR